MFDVVSCIVTEHNLGLVVVAAVICLLGTFTGFLLLDRGARVADARAKWTVAAAGATGITIWATHFVAMLAYDGGMPVGYDLGLTALSALAGVAISAIGFLSPRRRRAR